MARIYTRTGDGGETSLGDGSRVPKSVDRIDVYGEVDELNSVLGCCLQHLDPEGPGAVQVVRAALRDTQSSLFDLGAVLAHPGRSRELTAADAPNPFPTRRLEILIDSLTRELPPLRNFILPGGTPAAGYLHFGRTVCRRVERKAVALGAVEPVPAHAVTYLNRLSDFLFTAARAVNAAAGVADVAWRPAPAQEPPAGESEAPR